MVRVIKDKDQWNEVMRRCNCHDSYHTFDYHELSKTSANQPHLFVFEKGNSVIALPLLVREIEGTPFKDGTSVYGYAGPVSNNPAPDHQLIKEFTASLEQLFLQNQIVSVFSRLHPFMPQQLELLQNLGSLEQAGSVVYIDLNVPPEMQLVKYNKRLRTQVNKSRRNCRIYRAENADEILEFKKMYYQNMDRVNARKTYYFSADYFQELNECKEFNVRYYLIEERESKEIIGGGILLQHNHMAQYHLSGTRDGFQYLSPTKLLIDQMRQDASEAGAKYFNLGGGIGGSRDNLFRFKSLFSNDYKSFYLWKYIVNPAVYVELNRRDNKTKNHKYFPTYRS